MRSNLRQHEARSENQSKNVAMLRDGLMNAGETRLYREEVMGQLF